MSKHDSVPGWSEDIKALRRDLGLSQSQFGEKLKTTGMTVSRWEHGAVPPSSGAYLEFGKLAGARQGWHFWNLAGITKEDVQAMIGGETAHPSDRSILRVIAALEAQARLNETQAAALRAVIPYLPTGRLQREYRTITRASSEGVKVIRKQIVALKHTAA